MEKYGAGSVIKLFIPVTICKLYIIEYRSMSDHGYI